MSNPKRNVSVVTRARQYLAHRRSLGFALGTTGLILADFARFADGIGHRGPLTTDLILQWATQRDEHSARYQAARLSIVRGFAQYLVARDGKGHVPEQRLLASGYHRQQPHVYTDEQLRQLIRADATLESIYPLRPQTVATLLGLLASTGLRVSEALGLEPSDVDLEGGVLQVRQTKFRKSRIVPMHPTVTRAMRRYAIHRNGDPTCRSAISFFVGRHGRPLPYSTFRQIFRRLCRRLGWESNGALPLPRIHDLRHSFACRRLLSWYREGVDVNQAIPSLSTYLGHGKVTDTYWYLSGTGELLSVAGTRFERFASSARREP